VNSAGWGTFVLGVVLLLAGVTFALQGANYLGGSAMTGSSFWLYAGVVIAVLGVILLVGAAVWNSRRPKMATT
jgi:hypothetical protein